MKFIALVVLVGGGVAFLCLAGWIGLGLFKNWLFARRADAVEGVIVSLRREIARQFDSDTKSMRTETSSYPTVSYYTADGRSHTFTSDVVSSHKRRDKVRVLYNPYDPENAKIGSFVMLYGRPIAAMALCAAMCGFFLYMFTLLLQG